MAGKNHGFSNFPFVIQEMVPSVFISRKIVLRKIRKKSISFKNMLALIVRDTDKTQCEWVYY